MRIRMLKTMAGPEGVRQEGHRFEVADGVGAALIDAGVAEQISDVAAARATASEAEDGDLQGEVVALREQVATLQEEAKKPGAKKLQEAQERIAALKAEVEQLKAENEALQEAQAGEAPAAEDATDPSAANAEHATEPRQG